MEDTMLQRLVSSEIKEGGKCQMKVRVVMSLDGCEAASHVFDLAGEDNFGAGAQAAPDYSRENKPGGGAYDVVRLKLVLEKGLDRIEIFGGTSVGGDHQMVLRVERTGSEDLSQIEILGGIQTGTDKNLILTADRTLRKGPGAIVIFGGTPNGTNGGKILKADRVEIIVDIAQ
jgi:hypothetical protein